MGESASGSFERYRDRRVAHWDSVADPSKRRADLSGAYHRRLQEVYRFLIPPNRRVLEIGCGGGDLLAAVQPSVGVGVDFSSKMIEIARQRHPELHFIVDDAHEFEIDETFDFIILSDLLNDLWDVQAVVSRLHCHCSSRTRVIINIYHQLWRGPLGIARRLRLANPLLEQNWLSVSDLHNLLALSDFEPIKSWGEVLWPIRTPILERVFNRVVAKVWPFRWLAIAQFVVARPRPIAQSEKDPATVSVVIPARNERGNVADIIRRTPHMGKATELVFVEGHSSDGTLEAIEQAVIDHPDRDIKVLRQTGKGKGDAVRLGFSQANGDILVILDADLTVPPEDLPRFVEALARGRGDLINGVRLVYPMERRAMRFLNLVGNKAFSLIFTWILQQQIKDTLCGTKVLFKCDYEAIAAARSYFGDFDPFGDFDLLFGAAKLNMKIVDLPVRYRERTYGQTNIQRWRHGWLLLHMAAFAARRLRFV